MSENFGVSRHLGEHLTWLPEIQAKDVPLPIVIGWTGQAGKLIELSPPIRKIT
jgi:hypothetical protein